MPLDPAALEELRSLERESDPGLVRELAALFLAQAPRLVADIRGAADRGDARAAEEAAHLLKSSAANLGARELSDAAAGIERLGRERRAAELPARLAALEAALAGASADIANLK